MKTEEITIWQDDEYAYPMAFGFVPKLQSYIHEEDTAERPCMIVVPGGAYCVVSPTEGEIVAKKFYDNGYNAFVLTYTTNMLMSEPLKDQPMKDLGRAIRYVRKHAEEFHVRQDQLAICGFSAGGHLVGSVCVHHADIGDDNAEYAGISARPDAAILSYPVITSGEKAHQGSFIALLGAQPEEEELQYYSLEKQVGEDTPPCFLWQTVTDVEVPVENSAFFSQALKAQGIPFAYHVFSEGAHGMSLANEDWAEGRYGEPYTLEQIMKVKAAVDSGTIEVPEEAKQMLSIFDSMEDMSGERKADPEVAVWPELAVAWLKKQMQ